MPIIITNDMNKFIRRIYANQKSKKGKEPNYTVFNLIRWFSEQENFAEMYHEWETAGKPTDLVPSVDRIDSTSRYSLDNIQLVTWEENYENWKEEWKWQRVLTKIM